jgi:hypothetical protein
MRVVIFWPREYKNRYRTSTGVDSVDESMMRVVIFWPREHKNR